MNRFPTTSQQRAVLRKIDEAEASMLPMNWRDGLPDDVFTAMPAPDDQHPADEKQGRGLDHIVTGRTLSDVIVDALMLPVIALGWLVAGNPGGQHQAEQLADYLLAAAIAMALAWGAVEYFTT